MGWRPILDFLTVHCGVLLLVTCVSPQAKATLVSVSYLCPLVVHYAPLSCLPLTQPLWLSEVTSAQ